MWPWEHLAFGYLAYAAVARAGGTRVRPAGAVALAVGTQLPDLVDKPLAWWLGVLPSGLSLAHSALTALPVAAGAVLYARRRGRPWVGAGFAVGYLSHLAGDALYPALTGGRPALSFLLWPLVPARSREFPEGFLGQVGDLFGEFLAFLGTPRGVAYLLAELGLLAVALAVWRADGYPGLPVVRPESR